MNAAYTYPGDELALFQHARNWKAYFSKVIKPFIKGHVVEVGAGIGASTALLNDGTASSWLLLEPDAAMSTVLAEKISSGSLPSNCRLQTGLLTDLSGTFDTILYIDVLEHIEDDAAELRTAAAKLNPGGHIIVLSPAFQTLYNPFDKAIGHYRRYSKKSIRALTPASLQLRSNRYYDSVGYFAALFNKWLLRKKYPTRQQVLFWDRRMVPVSRITDLLCFHTLGKSIITVWQKPVG